MPRVPSPAYGLALALLAWQPRPALASETTDRALTVSRVDALCAAVQQSAPPASDRPDPAQREALRGCDSEALYFGIGMKADPVRARLCAFTEQSRESSRVVWGYTGSHLLMMIYANGEGTARNIAYAQNLACSTSFAPAERDLRVLHLQAISEGTDKGPFDYCHDATAGVTGGYCAAHQARIASEAEDRKIRDFASSLPHSARPAFSALVAQQKLWGDARAASETDLSGTLRAAFEIQERMLQLRDFTQMLARLGHRPLPPLGSAQLDTANTRMQVALKRLAGHQNIGGTTINSSDIEKAQSAFRTYRQAWGSFAATAYPHWGRDGAEAWVTMKRADMLEHLAALLD